MPLDIHHLYNKVDCCICGTCAQEGPYHPLDVELAQDGSLSSFRLLYTLEQVPRKACFLYRLLLYYVEHVHRGRVEIDPFLIINRLLIYMEHAHRKGWDRFFSDSQLNAYIHGTCAQEKLSWLSVDCLYTWNMCTARVEIDPFLIISRLLYMEHVHRKGTLFPLSFEAMLEGWTLPPIPVPHGSSACAGMMPRVSPWGVSGRLINVQRRGRESTAWS